MKAARSKYTLTAEQIKYRNNLFDKKNVPVIVKKQQPVIQKISRYQYMQNCMYWINEHGYVKRDDKELIDSLRHLKKHCEEFITELQTKTD